MVFLMLPLKEELIGRYGVVRPILADLHFDGRVAVRAEAGAAVGPEGAGLPALGAGVDLLLVVPHGGVAYRAVLGLFIPALYPLCVAPHAFVADDLPVPSGGFAARTPGRSFRSGTP